MQVEFPIKLKNTELKNEDLVLAKKSKLKKSRLEIISSFSRVGGIYGKNFTFSNVDKVERRVKVHLLNLTNVEAFRGKFLVRDGDIISHNDCLMFQFTGN